MPQDVILIPVYKCLRICHRLTTSLRMRYPTFIPFFAFHQSGTFTLGLVLIQCRATISPGNNVLHVPLSECAEVVSDVSVSISNVGTYKLRFKYAAPQEHRSSPRKCAHRLVIGKVIFLVVTCRHAHHDATRIYQRSRPRSVKRISSIGRDLLQHSKRRYGQR